MKMKTMMMMMIMVMTMMTMMTMTAMMMIMMMMMLYDMYIRGDPARQMQLDFEVDFNVKSLNSCHFQRKEKPEMMMIMLMIIKSKFLPFSE